MARSQRYFRRRWRCRSWLRGANIALLPLAWGAQALGAPVEDPPTWSIPAPPGPTCRSAPSSASTHAVPAVAQLEAAGARVGSVELVLHDIFDLSNPLEDRWLFRLANRLHRSTRPEVIGRLLLFDEGEPFDASRLEESERLLRACAFLYDASVEPVRYDTAANTVDVRVATRDVWTSSGGISVSRSGGENALRFEVEDTNLFGTGRELKLGVTDDVDRTSTFFRFRDSNLLGHRVAFETRYEDNSDGEHWSVDLERPFFSLDARWSAGLEALEETRVDSRYRLGEIGDRFRHRMEGYDLWAGRSRGVRDGRVWRWLVGASFRAHEFSPILDDPLSADASTLPADRTLVYPWVGFSTLPDDFRESRDLDQIARVEDLHLGWSFDGRLGWSSEALGADREAAIIEAGARLGRRFGDPTLLTWSTRLGGRWSDEGAENMLLSSRLRLYRRVFGRHLLYIGLSGDVAEELDAENQLLLGGDSGLRGYPLRYQSGTRRLLLTLEQRLFTRWYPFRLAHVGAAVFVDIGRTWNDDETTPLGPGGVGDADRGWLRDVGLGLRFASSRSGVGSVLHLDVAFPLDGDASIDDVQFLVSTKESF
ncbi:MAG: hypothetical protein AAGC60_10940 [Acidobacteriota bacterium]